MELTPDEAMSLLRSLSARADAARQAWDEARATRDELVATLDGQEGISRTAMAEACGLTRMNLWKMLERRPESVEEDVVLSDALRDAIDAAVEGVDLHQPFRLDVHA